MHLTPQLTAFHQSLPSGIAWLSVIAKYPWVTSLWFSQYRIQRLKSVRFVIYYTLFEVYD